jgi:hypothetical protein
MLGAFRISKGRIPRIEDFGGLIGLIKSCTGPIEDSEGAIKACFLEIGVKSYCFGGNKNLGRR